MSVNRYIPSPSSTPVSLITQFDEDTQDTQIPPLEDPCLNSQSPYYIPTQVVDHSEDLPITMESLSEDERIVINKNSRTKDSPGNVVLQSPISTPVVARGMYSLEFSPSYRSK